MSKKSTIIGNPEIIEIEGEVYVDEDIDPDGNIKKESIQYHVIL
jgi:hypothetical protein